MAPTSARALGALVLAAALGGGCSAEPAPRSDVGGQQTTTPTDATPAPSTTDGGVTVPATPNTPDLSGVDVDCSQIEEPCDHGDDPELDVLWDACATGDGRACDRLYYDAGFDTRYEQFGNTCGDRDVLVPCPDALTS